MVEAYPLSATDILLVLDEEDPQGTGDVTTTTLYNDVLADAFKEIGTLVADGGVFADLKTTAGGSGYLELQALLNQAAADTGDYSFISADETPVVPE